MYDFDPEDESIRLSKKFEVNDLIAPLEESGFLAYVN
jgi:hypothetical protein